jgi:hypothetical protein
LRGIVVVERVRGEDVVAAPDYEVKFFMDVNQVMDSDRKLNKRVREVFSLDDDVTRIGMQFLDDTQHDFDKAGWNVRIRKFEAERDFELTFKRRYSFDGGTLQETLATAAKDGFDADESDYAAQVEWGSKRTLTLSKRKPVALPHCDGLHLPCEADSREMSAEAAPGKLRRLLPQGWASQVLADAHVFGPVAGRRWTGSWSGKRVCIEAWSVDRAPELRDRCIVEISFKEDDEGRADDIRTVLCTLLETERWRRNDDALKTQLILKFY